MPATLNEVFSTLSMRRRYEVWFLRLGLADESGAWWFRYLLTNPGRGGCVEIPQGMPVQVWATWFPAGGKPKTFIQQFALSELQLTPRGIVPFLFGAGDNEIGDNYCRGALDVDGHRICWNLSYSSNFRATLSSKGWIGFSRTPHCDARFSGEITLDGRAFSGKPLGFGVQGHNCGYRHRNFWKWTHAYYGGAGNSPTTLEALVYEMPLGLTFAKALLCHKGRLHFLSGLRNHGDSNEMLWNFSAADRELTVRAAIDGRGASVHRLPYTKTNCAGTFEVANNSLASASLRITSGGHSETLETTTGAVLEIVR